MNLHQISDLRAPGTMAGFNVLWFLLLKMSVVLLSHNSNCVGLNEKLILY